MSIDTYIQLRTPFSAEQVRATLVTDPVLADLGLTDQPDDHLVAGADVCAMVYPWRGEDDAVIDHGFDTATILCTTIPGRGEAGWVAQARVIAAILREVPGDACLANQDAAGPGLLRLGGVVYLNPAAYPLEDLTDFGYTPVQSVIGMPDWLDSKSSTGTI